MKRPVYQIVDPKANEMRKYEFSVCFKNLLAVKLSIHELQNLRNVFDVTHTPCNTWIT